MPKYIIENMQLYKDLGFLGNFCTLGIVAIVALMILYFSGGRKKVLTNAEKSWQDNSLVCMQILIVLCIIASIASPLTTRYFVYNADKTIRVEINRSDYNFLEREQANYKYKEEFGTTLEEKLSPIFPESEEDLR